MAKTPYQRDQTIPEFQTNTGVLREVPRPGMTAPALPTLPEYTSRGGFGVTPDISRWLNPDYGMISRFGTMTGDEIQSIQNVSDIARLISNQGQGLFNIGTPGYTQAMNYYRRLLQGGRPGLTEAVAPEAGAIADVYKGAEASAAAGPLRGGAREAAAAEMNRAKAGQIAALIPAARQQAAAAAGALGLQGAQLGGAQEQAGAGLYGQLLSAEQANRQQAINQAMQQQQLGAQTQLGAARLTLDDLLQSGQLGLQEYQAMTGNNLALGKLSLDEYLGQRGLSLQQQQLAFQQKQYQDQQKAKKGGLLGKLLGSALSFIPGVGPELAGLFGGANLRGGVRKGQEGPFMGPPTEAQQFGPAGAAPSPYGYG